MHINGVRHAWFWKYCLWCSCSRLSSYGLYLPAEQAATGEGEEFWARHADTSGPLLKAEQPDPETSSEAQNRMITVSGGTPESDSSLNRSADSIEEIQHLKQ